MFWGIWEHLGVLGVYGRMQGGCKRVFAGVYGGSLENHMEMSMENEMETWFRYGVSWEGHSSFHIVFR